MPCCHVATQLLGSHTEAGASGGRAVIGTSRIGTVLGAATAVGGLAWPGGGLPWPVGHGSSYCPDQEHATQPGRIPADGHGGIVLWKNGGKVTGSRLLSEEALRITGLP